MQSAARARHHNPSVAIQNCLVIAQGKGGVGKTSLAANVAGLAAAEAGLRVLLIDLDPQANLRRNLGTPEEDGSRLFGALTARGDLPVITDVRPGLDLVPGGPVISDLSGVMFARHSRGGADLAQELQRVLTPIAGDYGLIVIDTPPGERLVVEAAMKVARFVVIPTEIDDASLDGLEVTAGRFHVARQTNPDLTLLGVALFRVDSRATKMEAEARTIITEVLQGAAPVFGARIRHQSAAARDSRRMGLLIHELEREADEVQRKRRQAGGAWWLASGEDVVDLRTRDAKGLSDDYWELTFEILEGIKRDLGATKQGAGNER